MGYYFFSIFLPGTLSQFYLYYATQERTVINSIDDIHKNKLAKFYNIKEFYIDKLKFGIHYFKNYYGGKLIMNFNYAFPVFNKPEDTVKIEPTAWLGFPYYKYLDFDSLKGTDIENREMQKFRKECDDKISAYNFRQFKRFERMDHSYLKLPLIKAVKKNNMRYEPNNLILIPEELQPNIYDADRVLFWFALVWLLSSVFWFLWLFLLKPNSTSRFNPNQKERIQDLKDFFTLEQI